MESKIELIDTTATERIYWITYTGETKSDLIDSYITVRLRSDGAIEFENATGGETIVFHPEQVERLEKLLRERNPQIKTARPEFKGWKNVWIPSGRRGGKKSRLPVGTTEMLWKQASKSALDRVELLKKLGDQANANLPNRTKRKRRAK
jgi:hypothetical protein